LFVEIVDLVAFLHAINGVPDECRAVGRHHFSGDHRRHAGDENHDELRRLARRRGREHCGRISPSGSAAGHTVRELHLGTHPQAESGPES